MEIFIGETEEITPHHVGEKNDWSRYLYINLELRNTNTYYIHRNIKCQCPTSTDSFIRFLPADIMCENRNFYTPRHVHDSKPRKLTRWDCNLSGEDQSSRKKINRKNVIHVILTVCACRVLSVEWLWSYNGITVFNIMFIVITYFFKISLYFHSMI